LLKELLCFLWLIVIMMITIGCSVQPALSGGTETPDRFARAEKYGQYIQVNRSVDCRGTRVTIENVLLDKTGIFMIAAVDGDIRGRTDHLNVDLFDEAGRELGRSSLLQKLPGYKTLLTFSPA